MGKGANKQLLSNSGVAQSDNSQLSGAASGISSTLTPQLESEAADPQGYTPQQLAYMNTASDQSLGGSTGAVTGTADLDAARTRNAGGFQGAIGSGSRTAERQLSQNALGIQGDQAKLQQAQKQQALSSLQSLYGVDEATAMGYLNSSNSALNSANQGSAIIDKNLWQNVQGIEQVLGQAGSAAAGGGE